MGRNRIKQSRGLNNRSGLYKYINSINAANLPKSKEYRENLAPLLNQHVVLTGYVQAVNEAYCCGCWQRSILLTAVHVNGKAPDGLEVHKSTSHLWITCDKANLKSNYIRRGDKLTFSGEIREYQKLGKNGRNYRDIGFIPHTLLGIKAGKPDNVCACG